MPTGRQRHGEANSLSSQIRERSWKMTIDSSAHDTECIQILGTKPRRKEPLGKPKRRWEDKIKVDINKLIYNCITFDTHMSVHRNTIPNYNQQDANVTWIYFYRRSTCFRRFLCPSSGAHNCTYSFRYCEPILLLAATVEKQLAAVFIDNTWSCMYSYVLLMMGGGTAWNM